MPLLHQSLSFKEWKNILYLQNLHLRASSSWETTIPHYKSERQFMQNNTGKQARGWGGHGFDKRHHMKLLGSWLLLLQDSFGTVELVKDIKGERHWHL